MLVRRIARPLLASIFVVMGVDSVRDPSGRARAVEAFAHDYGAFVPAPAQRLLASEPENVVRANGVVQAGCGLMLATGKYPRPAAAALATTLVPTTVAGHPFWEETDPDQRKAQMVHFLKNLGLAGGLLLASVDTEGKPSLGWRGRQAARRAGRAALHARQDLSVDQSAIRHGEDAADAALRKGATVAAAARRFGGGVVEAAAQRGSDLAEVGAQRGGEWADIAGKRGSELADAAGKQGGEWAEAAAHHGSALADTAAQRGGELVDAAAQRGGELLDRAQAEAPEWGRKVRRSTRRLARKSSEAAGQLTDGASRLRDLV